MNMAELARIESARMNGALSIEAAERVRAKAEARKAGHGKGMALIEAFAAERGVSVDALIGRDDKRVGRSGEIHRARWECWAMLRRETSLSYPQIGRMFGGRHHTTIMHGAGRIVQSEA